MLAHHHEIGAVFLEMLDLSLRMGAADDEKLRIDGPGLLHHLPALEGIGNGNQKAARLAKICGSNQRGIGGIADDPFDALRLEFGDQILVVLNDEDWGFGLAQDSTDEAAHSAMADQHHMVGQSSAADRLARRRRLFDSLGRRPVGDSLPAPRENEGERRKEEWIEDDADNGAGEDAIADLGPAQTETQAKARKDEGELTDLRERRRDGQSGRPWKSKQ